jgi:hypothetical protein
MRIFQIHRQALISVTAAILSGCGVGQPPASAPGSTPPYIAPVAPSKHDVLWVLSLQNEGLGDYLVAFSWPQVKRVAALGPLGLLLGICADEKGDVFVMSRLPNAVREYAYAAGRIQRIRTLALPHGKPIDCAVDPITGDLAVSTLAGRHGGQGVDVYNNARGRPVSYKAPNVALYESVTYDQRDDLFVNGHEISPDEPKLLELAAGATAFTNVALERKIEKTITQLQWIDDRLAISTYDDNVIYRAAISAAKAKIIGKTLVCYSIENLILDDEVLALCGSTLSVYNYPAGRKPVRRYDLGAFAPMGFVVSVSSSR